MNTKQYLRSAATASAAATNRSFSNVYEDRKRARAYATLEFPRTYYLAYRDLPAIVAQYGTGGEPSILAAAPAVPPDS